MERPDLQIGRLEGIADDPGGDGSLPLPSAPAVRLLAYIKWLEKAYDLCIERSHSQIAQLKGEKEALVSHIEKLESEQIRPLPVEEVGDDEEVALMRVRVGLDAPAHVVGEPKWGFLVRRDDGKYDAGNAIVYPQAIVFVRKRRIPSIQQELQAVLDRFTAGEFFGKDDVQVAVSDILEHFEVKRKEGGE